MKKVVCYIINTVVSILIIYLFTMYALSSYALWRERFITMNMNLYSDDEIVEKFQDNEYFQEEYKNNIEKIEELKTNLEKLEPGTEEYENTKYNLEHSQKTLMYYTLYNTYESEDENEEKYDERIIIIDVVFFIAYIIGTIILIRADKTKVENPKKATKKSKK